MNVRKYLFSLVTALALMISAPVVMACGSCHVDTGVLGYQAVDVFDVGNPAIELAAISVADEPCVSCSAFNVPAVMYIEPRKRLTYEKPVNNGFKVTDNQVSAHAQAKPYAGVTAA